MHPAHGGVLALFGAAVTSFLATNLDALAILAPLLWLPPGGGRRLPVLIGCCVGNAAVLTLAVLAAAGLGAVPDGQMHWVGLLPIGIGIYRLLPRSWLAADRGRAASPSAQPGCGEIAQPSALLDAAESTHFAVSAAEPPEPPEPHVAGKPAKSLFAHAGLTLALGGDNIAILAPLFRALGPGGSAVVGATHLVLFPLFLALPTLAARSAPEPPRLARPASACLSIVIGTVIVAG